MRRIAVAIFKGGTGKSSTAVNAGVGLARRGRRVLLVDLDAQGSTTRVFHPESDGPTIREVLVDGVPVADAVREVEENLDLLPSSRSLAPVDTWLTTQMRREEIVRRRLETVTGYDYVILDCAPAWSLLNVNALVYASEIWIPVSMDFLALVGVQQLEETLTVIGEELGHDGFVRRLVPTFFDGRTRKSHEVLAALQESYGDAVTPAIRSSVRISEAPSHGMSVFDFAPSSSGAEDYGQLVAHLEGG